MTRSRRSARTWTTKWPAPTCIVHVGTHKTGSTALQSFLQANAETLAESGILVPASGRLADTPDGSGHHCIAWDVLGADPSSPVDGSLERLIEEIRCAAQPTVCISSEEFAHLWAMPNNMQRLKEGLRGIGYRAVIVMYLRPQADYLEALYAEVAQHAAVRDFWACYREVLKHGAVDLWAASRFAAPLDYDRFLVAPFRRIFGDRNVIVRPFRRFGGDDRLILDFMEIVAGPGFPTAALTLHVPAGRNARAGFAAVAASIARNRRRGPLDADSARAVEGHFEVLRAHEVARICQRFARSNLALFLRYGIVVGCVSRVRLVHLFAHITGRRRNRLRVRLLRALFDERAPAAGENLSAPPS